MFEKTIVTAIVVAILFSANPVAAAPDQPLAISLSTEQSEICLGEPLRIRVTVTNVLDNPVTLPASWEEDCLRLRLTYDGQIRERYNTAGLKLVQGYRLVQLASQQSYSADIDFLYTVSEIRPTLYALEAILESPGQYPTQDLTTGKTILGKCWGGKIISPPLKIRIKALTKADDIHALEILAQHANLKQGYLGTIWWPWDDDKRFQTVIEKYPTSVFARHAEFALAEEYAREKCWDEAVRHYTNVIEKYPRFHFTDDAILGLAKLYVKKLAIGKNTPHYDPQADRKKADELLKSIVEKYPDSDSAAEAKKLLVHLEGTPHETQKAPTEKMK